MRLRIFLFFLFPLLLLVTIFLIILLRNPGLFNLNTKTPPSESTLYNFKLIQSNSGELAPGLSAYAAYVGPMYLRDYIIQGSEENQVVEMTFAVPQTNTEKTFKIKQVPCSIDGREVKPIENTLKKNTKYTVSILGTSEKVNKNLLKGSENCKSVWGNLKPSNPEEVRDFFVSKSKFNIFSLFSKSYTDLSDTVVGIGVYEHD